MSGLPPEDLPVILPGLSLSAGSPAPLGASVTPTGVNFALFSANADRVELCLFDATGATELARIPLTERSGDIWHVHVEGLLPGQLYGYRVHGPYLPAEGHRFNAAKLLIDPYARALHGAIRWDDALYGYIPGHEDADLSFNPLDSAPFMPKCMVTETPPPAPGPRPEIDETETLIYEAHLKGLTRLHPAVPEPQRGRALGLCTQAILDHLRRLGVTSLELQPVQAHVDDRFLIERGLSNYWGYQPLAFFVLHPEYAGTGGFAEFRTAAQRLHAAGIEVILDVVYNHTGEGDHLGPTLSWRGIDNLSYYRLVETGRFYANDTGTGNTLNLAEPMVLRMVMDSLRHWVEAGGVDGFRFDLATVLAREAEGFDPGSGFLDAIRQDPLLQGVKLIAEPWDLGPGGYQLGAWPWPFLEWNDRFRDGVRRFWRGDAGLTGDLARRITGSAELFDHSGRPATSSVNFVTAHDGFTLEDLVSYRVKHNEANGEGGRDGRDENFSDNLGVEGPTTDPAIRAARDARKRAMLATLLLSQGTPMLLGGDEIGNSQSGNNNAYAQDNEIGWIDWRAPDERLARFVARLAALRRAHPVLRQRRFLHARPRLVDGKPDIFWRLPSGAAPTPEDWQDPAWRALCVEIRAASGTPRYAATDDAIFAVFNAGSRVEVQLPDCPAGMCWEEILDSAAPEAPARVAEAARVEVAAQSVKVFTRRLRDQGGKP
ncbi:MAG: glycogen debranching enzyme GlgX [Alphaproteobacteria bacterium]|nr:MAG: glycogen debranching enzyme GlgX [Alphaproteobacteria bacterium]